jgi:hypothetical protein
MACSFNSSKACKVQIHRAFARNGTGAQKPREDSSILTGPVTPRIDGRQKLVIARPPLGETVYKRLTAHSED